MTGSIDWDAPLNAEGEARTRALHIALKVSMEKTHALIDAMRAEISSAEWGYPQLAAVAEVEQRALISDQLLSAAEGVEDALVDIGISARELTLHTGGTGVPYPAPENSLNDVLRDQQIRRAVAAFFDAVGTALDCLAAVLVVVARVPLSVQRSDFTQLAGLDATKAHEKAFGGPVSSALQTLWQELLAEVAAARLDGPDDWLAWSLEMRNALTHRGRVTNVFLPRQISGRLLVPPTTAPQRLYRYDLHLRRRPWLPGLEQLLSADGMPDSWLDEPATRTVDGLRDTTLRFCERLAVWAHTTWDRPDQPALDAPVHRWVLPPDPPIDFTGVNPGGTVPIAGAIGGVNEEHLRLAERIRRRRERLPDL